MTRALPPIQVADVSGQGREESESESRIFFADQQWIHFVGMAQRPGVADCLQTMEHSHYPPESDGNDNFHLRILQWEEIVWFITSIPRVDYKKMEAVALACGLRITNGVPRIINDKGLSSFPIDQDNVFTLENIPTHPIYRK